ncbi:hypothetical protein [Aneurinibacillus tyrosinisolvens]|uniref:hypothetical protein n=1 Tax=Aneurinibacillus tyrosinisolvens TaxID=1443435 RepID=UPI00063FC986|nr:hypothetical protein [Aneurinibacillus tyrosinisolvens]
MPQYVIDAESRSAALWFDAIRDPNAEYEEGKVTLHLGTYNVICRGRIKRKNQLVHFSASVEAESMDDCQRIGEEIEELLLDYVSFSAGYTPRIDVVKYACRERKEKEIKKRLEHEFICYSPHQAQEIIGFTINRLKTAFASPQIRNALHYMRLAEEMQRDPKLRMLLFTKVVEAIIGHARKKLPWVLSELGMDEAKDDVQSRILNLRNAADIAHSPNAPELLHSAFDVTQNTLIEAHKIVSLMIIKAMKYIDEGKDLTKLKISYYDKNK